jgi:two-component system LytT family response regulator
MERNGAPRAAARPAPAMRTVLVDDEPLAVRKLRRLLSGERDVEIVAECADGRSAAETIRQLNPDLLFLDIQIPELDGFEVVESLPADRLPVIIFVTAYDEHALRAFDVHALDYLLKPVARERFREALDGARERVLQRRVAGVIDSRLLAFRGSRATPASDSSDGAPRHLSRIAVKAGGRAYFVRADEIDWIEASDNYARLHTGATTHLLRESLRTLEAKLDPRTFLRVHRSAIVNVDAIRELQPWFHGDHIVILRSGARLMCSRRYDERLRRMLGNEV